MTILSTLKEVIRIKKIHLWVFLSVVLLFTALLFFSSQKGIEEEAFQYFIF